MQNFVPISRDILDHWIYKDAAYFKIWFEMLARARYIEEPKTDMYRGIIYTLNRGEFIFGIPSWSERLGIGQQRLRTLIKKLTNENMISLVKAYPKFTIYTITNYEKFNNQTNNQTNNLTDIENTSVTDDANNQTNNQTNNLLTTFQQPSNNLLTTNEECKEGEQCTEGNKKDNKFSSDSNEHRLSLYLFNYIKRNNPSAKEPDFETWSKHFDYILRIDKRPIDEVKKVIEYCQKNSFWLSNILSPSKLREKYDQLMLQMKNPIKGKNGKDRFNDFEQRQDSDPDYTDNIEKRKLQQSDKEAAAASAEFTGMSVAEMLAKTRA
jgi:hypothetical protein